MEKKQQPLARFRGGPMGMGGGGTPQKAKHLKKTLIRILGYLRPYWWYLGFVAVCAIISTIFAIISPKVLGNMTDEIIKGLMGHTGINFNAINSIGLWLIGLYVISASFSYIQSWLMTTISQKVTYAFRRYIS